MCVCVSLLCELSVCMCVGSKEPFCPLFPTRSRKPGRVSTDAHQQGQADESLKTKKLKTKIEDGAQLGRGKEDRAAL